MNTFETTKEIDFKLIHISSPSFRQNEMIPEEYTCDGKNVSPPLQFSSIPKETVSLAIIVDDPDAPSGTFTHWVCWNIPLMHHLAEGQKGGLQGINDFGNNGYKGPCPPQGTHRYYFKVYALDSILELPEGSDKKSLEKSMSEHIIGLGILIGTYKKKK